MKRAIHVLPRALDVERVLADQAAGARFERVASAALADAGDVGVGLDGDDHVALQERDLQRHDRRRFVEAYPRDLCLGQCGFRPRGPEECGCRCCRCRLDKGSTIHLLRSAFRTESTAISGLFSIFIRTGRGSVDYVDICAE
jgi:hypothetical protein